MKRISVLALLVTLLITLSHICMCAQAVSDEAQTWQTLERQFSELPMEARRYTGPLFWLHGDESPEVLQQYLQKVAEGGQGSFTAESRPHSDWLGEGWYRDLEVCLEAARKLDLKMWIFDERWWPSGEVGGKVPQEYGSKYVQVSLQDAQGPSEFALTDLPENLVAVIAGPSVGDAVDGQRLLDLTGQVANGSLRWKVPQGAWKVMVFRWEYSTGRGGRILVDGVSRSAVDWYIRTVYQPHFDRLGQAFGKEIVGYFYDEPETYGDWGPTVFSMLQRRGIDFKQALVAWKLKLADEDQQIAARYQYQDALAEAWGETLYGGLTQWCHEHNVQSIGHFLEHGHEYLHPRLCAGNMMQLQKYSDMGAIDAVFKQFVPGQKDDSTYQTPKLGSSVSHVYGKKDDLAMVEIFGARGQDLTYPEMKWWTDLMHVAGINFHIPHSFNPRSPYDRDCPPYFYNSGYEPRWPLFRVYADYTSRLTLLLTGGRHVCPVALLYLGNSYHVGKSITPENMTTALQDALFDCDWIPYEVFEEDMQIRDRQLLMRDERFRVLIVPAVEVIPYATLAKAKAFYEAGGVVIGYGMLPSRSATLGKTSRDIHVLTESIWSTRSEPGFELCQSNAAGGRSYFLPAQPTAREIQQVLVDDAEIHPTLEVLEGNTDDWLHVLHRVKAGRDVFLVCNQQHEGSAKTFRLRCQASGVPECWDAIRNEIRGIEYERVTETAVDLTLTLQPLESIVIHFAPEESGRPMRLDPQAQPAYRPIDVERLPAEKSEPRTPVVQQEQDPRLDLKGCYWVWYPGDRDPMKAPPGARYFRREIQLPADCQIQQAKFRLSADNYFTLYVNGQQVGDGDNFQMPRVVDLQKQLKPGPNALAVVASNGASNPNPAGLIGRYFIQLQDGELIAGTIDQSWKCNGEGAAGWMLVPFDDARWQSAKNIALCGAAPWGNLDGSQMLTRSPVTADPFNGQFSLPQTWISDSLRICLETKTIEPENAAAITVNGKFAGGFIGRPNRLDITDHVQPGMNQVKIEPFAPGGARVVAYARQSAKNGVSMSVQLDLDPDVYTKTRYKHPPQFATWLEDPATGTIRTLYVTQKLGRGTWNGKATVPVTLPYWVSRHNAQTGTQGDPTLQQPLPDAITQPTPTQQFQVRASVPPGSKWHCYVEVNVSGDFNEAFPAQQPDGAEDKYGNGQPSLVYRAVIDAKTGAQTAFELVGRTSQLEASPELKTDLAGITTAKKLFTKMRVSCDGP